MPDMSDNSGFRGSLLAKKLTGAIRNQLSREIFLLRNLAVFARSFSVREAGSVFSEKAATVATPMSAIGRPVYLDTFTGPLGFFDSLTWPLHLISSGRTGLVLFSGFYPEIQNALFRVLEPYAAACQSSSCEK